MRNAARLGLIAITGLLVFAAAARDAGATLAANLVLNPNTGNPPSVTGSLGGVGWCYPGTLTVSGLGVTGSASVSSIGNLSGTFTVTGSAGQSRLVKVAEDCPGIVPIHVEDTKNFTFNAATPTPTVTPTRTPTPLPAATWTPTPAPAGPTWTPTPAAAGATATPTPQPGITAVPVLPQGPSPTPTEAPLPVITSAPATITFGGCKPSASQIQVEFVPLYLMGVDAPSSEPSGPGIMVPAVQSPGDPTAYSFASPAAEPGRLFKYSAQLDDKDCPLETKAATGFWLPGNAIIIPVVLPGITTLEGCGLINKSPCALPLVKGAFVRSGEQPEYSESPLASQTEGSWMVDLGYNKAGDLKGRNQRFRSTSNLTGDKSNKLQGKLQASVLPFANGNEDDYFAPPGLVASWDVECLGCEFVVDLSPLAPASKPQSKSLLKKGVDVVEAPFKLAGKGAKKVVGIFKKKKSPPAGAKVGKILLPSTTASDYLVDGAANVLLQPTTFYFRLLPLNGEKKVAGAPSTIVRLQQVANIDFKFDITPTPTPTVSPYEVEIISYNGIIPPINEHKSPCYIVTQDAWPLDIFGHYTTDPSKALISQGVKKGDSICEPEPEEPDIFEVIVSWAKSAVDWASKAWSDIKKFAVDVVLKYTPLGSICDSVGAKSACEAGLSTALNAALISMGIPPELPNFDQLVDQGIDYLAAQAAAQMAIPPEVVKAATDQGGVYAGLALGVAEEKLREELKSQIKANMADGIKSIQLGYAASVSWVTDGIPVRPDDYQPPGMTIRVTRKPGVPGGDQGCTATVRDNLQLDAALLQNPPAGYENFVKNLPHPLSQLTPYDFFANEADLTSQGFPGGSDKVLSVPPLAPGESFTIPMTFVPNYYKNGWQPLGGVSTSLFIGVWLFMHDFGTVHMNVSGCGGATLVVPANWNYVATENKGTVTGQ